jgi:hypothetical protein
MPSFNISEQGWIQISIYYMERNTPSFCGLPARVDSRWMTHIVHRPSFRASSARTHTRERGLLDDEVVRRYITLNFTSHYIKLHYLLRDEIAELAHDVRADNDRRLVDAAWLRRRPTTSTTIAFAVVSFEGRLLLLPHAPHVRPRWKRERRKPPHRAGSIRDGGAGAR